MQSVIGLNTLHIDKFEIKVSIHFTYQQLENQIENTIAMVNVEIDHNEEIEYHLNLNKIKDSDSSSDDNDTDEEERQQKHNERTKLNQSELY